MTFFKDLHQGNQKIRKKICLIFQRIAKSCQVKKGQNIYNKAQFECPKHLHQTTLPTTNTYNKPCFETAYLGKNVINLFKQKVAKKSCHYFGLLHPFKKS